MCPRGFHSGEGWSPRGRVSGDAGGQSSRIPSRKSKPRLAWRSPPRFGRYLGQRRGWHGRGPRRLNADRAVSRVRRHTHDRRRRLATAAAASAPARLRRSSPRSSTRTSRRRATATSGCSRTRHAKRCAVSRPWRTRGPTKAGLIPTGGGAPQFARTGSITGARSWAKPIARCGARTAGSARSQCRHCDSPVRAGREDKAVAPTPGRARSDLGDSDRAPQRRSGWIRTSASSPKQS
jgi:hypothetical protein